MQTIVRVNTNASARYAVRWRKSGGSRYVDRVRSLIAASLVLALGVVLGSARPAAAEVVDDEYSSQDWGVSITAPKNWQLAEQTSYPNILLWAVRTNPRGRMLLSAERVEAKVDAIAYATQTSKALETLGFSVRPPQLHAPTGAYWVDFDNGVTFLRQAFVVANGIGYAITLSADDARTRNQHLRAFDYFLRRLSPKRARPSEPPATAPNASQGSPAPATAEGGAPTPAEAPAQAPSQGRATE